MAKGGGKNDNRGLIESIVILVLLGLMGLEMHMVYGDWWPVFEVWIERNPLAILLTFIALMAGPIAIFMKMKTVGKKLGSEIEAIVRSRNIGQG